jgi:hypothetical protein
MIDSFISLLFEEKMKGLCTISRGLRPKWIKSRSSEIKNGDVVLFKGSTNMNELKKKVEGGPSKSTKFFFFLRIFCILLTLVENILKSKLLRPDFFLFY